MVVNVVCLKTGDKYSSDYVNKLAAMVRRNLSRPHRFVCLTDVRTGIHDSIECLPLLDDDIPGLTGWWHKLSLFRPEVHDLTGPTLFLDLDIVITDEIDSLFDHPGEVCIIRDWAYKSKKVWNSSVFRLVIGQQSHVYSAFLERCPTTIMAMYQGDQNFISEMMPDATTWPSQWCISFKYHCCIPRDAEPSLPDGSKIVVFHGRPNPDEAIVGTHRRYRPAPWISSYWRDDDLLEFTVESGPEQSEPEDAAPASRGGRDTRRRRIRMKREIAVVEDMLKRLSRDASTRRYYENRLGVLRAAFEKL